MNLFELTTDELEVEVTKVKNLIVSYLKKKGHLEPDVANDLLYNYGIIVKKPSFFTRLWKKKNTLSQNTQYVLIKQVTIEESSPEDPKQNLTLLKPAETDKEI